MTAYRLYLVNSRTGLKTGKKRDYPSLDHFYKYGIETYKRYDRREWFTGEPTGLKAELCFLNERGRWEKVEDKYIEGLLNQEYVDE